MSAVLFAAARRAGARSGGGGGGDAIPLTLSNPTATGGSQVHVGYIPFTEGEYTPEDALAGTLSINGSEVACYVRNVETTHTDGSARGVQIAWTGASASVTTCTYDPTTAAGVSRAAEPTWPIVPVAILWPDTARLCASSPYPVPTQAAFNASASATAIDMLADFDTIYEPELADNPAASDSRGSYYDRAMVMIDRGRMLGDPSYLHNAFQMQSVTTHTGGYSGLTWTNYLRDYGSGGNGDGGGPEWNFTALGTLWLYRFSGHVYHLDCIKTEAMWTLGKVVNAPGFYVDCGSTLPNGRKKLGTGDNRSHGKYLIAHSIACGILGLTIDVPSLAFDVSLANFKTDIPRLLTCMDTDGRWGGLSYSAIAPLALASSNKTVTVSSSYRPAKANFENVNHTISTGDLLAIPSTATVTAAAVDTAICVVWAYNGSAHEVKAGNRPASAIGWAFPTSGSDPAGGIDQTVKLNLNDPDNPSDFNIVLTSGYYEYARLVILVKAGQTFTADTTTLTDVTKYRWAILGASASSQEGVKSYMVGTTITGLTLAHDVLHPTTDSALRTTILDAVEVTLDWMFANAYRAGVGDFNYTTIPTLGNGEAGDGSGTGEGAGLEMFILQACRWYKARTGLTTFDAYVDDMIAACYTNKDSWLQIIGDEPVCPQPKQFDEAFWHFFRAQALGAF